MRTILFVPIFSATIALILTLLLNQSIFSHTDWLSAYLISAVFIHVAWLTGFFSIAVLLGLRYRAESALKRWAVTVAAMLPVLALGSAWSGLLLVSSSFVEHWANYSDSPHIEVLGRVISRLTYAHPWSSFTACAIVLLFLLSPVRKLSLGTAV